MCVCVCVCVCVCMYVCLYVCVCVRICVSLDIMYVRVLGYKYVRLVRRISPHMIVYYHAHRL